MDILKIVEVLKKIREKIGFNYVGVDDLFILASLVHYEDEEVNKNLTWYFNSQLVYDPEGCKYIIPWKSRIEYLMKVGLLEKSDAFYRTTKEGNIIIEPSKLTPSKLFIEEIYVEKTLKESLFDVLSADVWGDQFFMENTFPNNTIPTSLRTKGFTTPEDLINLFWKKVNFGDKNAVEVFFNNAKKYKEKYPTYSLSRFILEYEYLIKNLK